MDNEMIERVAEAIRTTPNASDYKILVAINAIKAMREPTEKMIDKASGIPNYDDADVGDSLAKDIYQVMIDAVIND